MSNQLIAQITDTVTVQYHNEPAPSDYINISLQRRGAMGDWVEVQWDEVSIEDPGVPVSFTIADPGQYRVVCRRSSVSDTLMGPSAESPTVYVGSGEYMAPLSVTLTIAPPAPT